MPASRMPDTAVFMMPIVVVLCCLFAWGSVVSATQDPHPSPTASGRVVGTLVDSTGTHRAEVEVFLVKAFVMERDSKGDFHHAVKLPAKQPFIVGTPTEDKPVATKSDLQGRFEFNGIPPGRYFLGLKRKDTPRSGESKYDILYSGEAMIVFDLASGETKEAGRVFQKAR
jgi:hypothetical protein